MADGTLKAHSSPANPYFGVRDASPMARTEVVTLTEGTNMTAGTFTLTFGGQTTTAIAYDATGAAIVAALIALSTIPVAGVTSTGGPITTTPLVITFASTLAERNVGAITADLTSLTGTFTIAVTTAGVGGESPVDTASAAAEARAAQTATGLEGRDVDNAIKVSATQHMMS